MEWVTLFAGAAIAIGSAWLQQWWAQKNLRTTLAAKRDEEVRARADDRAIEALAAVDRLETLLLRRGPLLAFHRLPSPLDDRYAEYEDALAVVRRSAVFIQRPLRQHLEAAVTIVPDVDLLAQQQWVAESPRAMLWHLLGETQEHIGAYLRNESIGPLSNRVASYLQASADLSADIERQVEEQEKADAEAETPPS